jgi:hypothetical protein
MDEFDDLILANGIKLDSNGYLTKESLKIASQLAMLHDGIPTIEDEKELQAQLQRSNAIYTYAELSTCTCTRCRKLWKTKPKKEDEITLATTRPHPS